MKWCSKKVVPAAHCEVATKYRNPTTERHRRLTGLDTGVPSGEESTRRCSHCTACKLCSPRAGAVWAGRLGGNGTIGEGIAARCASPGLGVQHCIEAETVKLGHCGQVDIKAPLTSRNQVTDILSNNIMMSLRQAHKGTYRSLIVFGVWHLLTQTGLAQNPTPVVLLVAR